MLQGRRRSIPGNVSRFETRSISAEYRDQKKRARKLMRADSILVYPHDRAMVIDRLEKT